MIIIIKTSYFAKYNGKNGVSIACGEPNGFSRERYPKLAPEWENVKAYKDGKIDRQEYTKRYKRQLQKLDPQSVYEDLDDKVLLCWEASNKFCHRFIAAEWLENKLNIKVEEI
ncbi:MAG: DUF488 family protein [Bacteroidota bacterium]